MKRLLSLSAVALTVLLVSCNSGGGGGGGSTTGGGGTSTGGGGSVDKTTQFVNLLNEEYAYDSRSTFYVAKRPERTLTENFVVVYSDDTGYIAYDLKDYKTSDSWSNYNYFADYQPVYIDTVERDVYSGEMYYTGDAFRNDSYSTYDGRFVFEKLESATKDLSKLKAFKESFLTSKMAEGLQNQFGLSEERSVQVAQLVKSWSKVSKTRSMTVQDADAFSKQLVGVSVKDIEKAVIKKLEGDAASYDQLIQKASSLNDLTPEQTNKIVNELM